MKPILWALAALLAIASLMERTGGTVEPKPNTPFVTFEQRIKAEVWAAAATKIRMGDFENARKARDWAEEQWVKVGGESFAPLDKEEAIAGQDLDALAALWERWSK